MQRVDIDVFDWQLPDCSFAIAPHAGCDAHPLPVCGLVRDAAKSPEFYESLKKMHGMPIFADPV
jgi:hypothetical protein